MVPGSSYLLFVYVSCGKCQVRRHLFPYRRVRPGTWYLWYIVRVCWQFTTLFGVVVAVLNEPRRIDGHTGRFALLYCCCAVLDCDGVTTVSALRRVFPVVWYMRYTITAALDRLACSFRRRTPRLVLVVFH